MTALTHSPEGWTVADVLALPESNDRYELLDGVLQVSPWPGMKHQRVSANLQLLLTAAAAMRSLRVVATVNVEMPGGNLLVPDLVVVSQATATADQVKTPASEILLAVEIVSRSSRKMDRLIKPTAYAEAGVAHYWRVEIDPTPEVLVYSKPTAGGYQSLVSALATERLTSSTPVSLSFTPKELLL